MKADIAGGRLRCEALGVVDVRRHSVDAVEDAGRMRRRENHRSDPLAAAQVAPCKAAAAVGRLDPAHQRHMV